MIGCGGLLDSSYHAALLSHIGTHAQGANPSVVYYLCFESRSSAALGVELAEIGTTEAIAFDERPESGAVGLGGDNGIAHRAADADSVSP